MTEQRAIYHAGPDRPRAVKIWVTGLPVDVAAVINRVRPFLAILDAGEDRPAAMPNEVSRCLVVLAADEPQRAQGEQLDLFQSGS